MKPRIGVYLSEQMAARLAAAAKRRGTSKSALVEAALAQFLGDNDDADNVSDRPSPFLDVPPARTTRSKS
jgi:metal-responsive CopG/Arc/MetJ family transcriptional regulator